MLVDMTPRDAAATAPVFVVGPPRSGTTLTARLLGELPRLFMPGETHFLEDIYRREARGGELPPRLAGIIARLRTLYGRFNEPADQQRIDTLWEAAAFERELTRCRSLAEVLQTFMSLQAASAGKPRWGNQVPRDVFELDTILRLFPGARIIACIRDPRDFLVSYRDKWTISTEGARLRRLYHPLLTSYLWKASARAILAGQRRCGGAIHVTRYEDLVREPATRLRELCAFIGEDFDPRLLATRFSNSSTGARLAGIATSSAGRWREDLPVEDAYFAQRICGPVMRQFGYLPVSLAPDRLKAARIALGTPARAIGALSANRSRRGATLPYLVRRIRALVTQLD
jgi:Sulfotransferase family